MRPRTKAFAISALLTALLIAGCGGRMTAYDALYSDLSEGVTVYDPSVLSGRRIVIDPGHGGEYDGALGADSLSEAEVNLGVALYLWGLLNDAGAQVHMTRSSDRDFLPEGTLEVGADLASLLRDDLEARMEKANDVDPEVFISIHHNSNLALDREKNAVEVYYRGTDPGPSLELATDIHTHLARNLGIATTTIKPGNYYVLRNSSAGAAVLGEASYISHPAVEERLKLSAKQKLEAEAYYLGLIEYFSRGIPAIAMIEPATDTLSAPVKIEFSVEPSAGSPIDTTSFEAWIDGGRIECFFPSSAGGPFCLMPSSLLNGPFTITFSARSTAGATARFGPKKMLLDRDARFFLPLEPGSGGDGRAILKVLVLDAEGRPVADGKQVTLRKSGEKGGTAGRTRKGVASFVRRTASGNFILSSGGEVDTLVFGEIGADREIIALAIDGITGSPVPGAVLRFPDGRIAAGDAAGAIRSAQASVADAVIYAPGYQPERLISGAAESGAQVPVARMKPIFGGVLHGRKIAIDPAGGGSDDAGRGAGALRGATVNLRLAGMIERTLAAAGASVIVTRSGEELLSDEQRIFTVNRFGADLAIRLRLGGISTDEPGCSILHYPGSISGKEAADSLASSITGTPPCESATAVESASLFLQQTNCPAVVILAGSLADPGDEILLGSRDWMSLEAEAIIRGLLGYFGGKDRSR